MKRLGLMASLLLATTVQGQELTAAEQFLTTYPVCVARPTVVS